MFPSIPFISCIDLMLRNNNNKNIMNGFYHFTLYSHFTSFTTLQMPRGNCVHRKQYNFCAVHSAIIYFRVNSRNEIGGNVFTACSCDRITTIKLLQTFYIM